MKKYIPAILLLLISFASYTQDSIRVRVHPGYDNKSGFHRFLFGENYRKEWSAELTLPLIRISEFAGGLVPDKLGGGMQSRSLRLKDRQGKEWVIRSVEKNAEAVLPESLRKSFARDWVDDATSAQHPFAALVVPPIANAVAVPHSTPVIGVIAPDPLLGEHLPVFGNMIALVEEREPLGESDNTAKMKKNLLADNDNSIDGRVMLRARLLDMLIGDWDRHEDQWRWYDTLNGKGKKYIAVPRDRDQVFHLTQGVIPQLAAREYVLPFIRSFDRNIKRPEWLTYKTRFVNAYPSMQFSREEWVKETDDFIKAVTDSVLETALRRLPSEIYRIRHDELLETLKARRDGLHNAVGFYYQFIHRIADIQLSHKNEFVKIFSDSGKNVNVEVYKISRKRKSEDRLLDKVFSPAETKELRIFLHDGMDSVWVDNSSDIKLRIIGGKGPKTYHIESAQKRIRLYDKNNGSVVTGRPEKIKTITAEDSMHTAFTPVSLYHTTMPLVTAGLNLDDGLIIGAGVKFTRQGGFRKEPHAAEHQVMAAYSFSTGAFRIRHSSEWIRLIGNTDFILQSVIRAPHNTRNFFGRGNETSYERSEYSIRHYRTRFSTYQLDPLFRIKRKSHDLRFGPSLFYYTYDPAENQGRFINNIGKIGSYDSASIDRNRLHLGVVIQHVYDNRSNKTIPQHGAFLNIRFHAYRGMNAEARDYAQIVPELSVYKAVNRSSSIVIAERIGGTIGFGQAAFYQSAFIGGHENLLGFRQFRFAGRHSFYNNFELRIRMAEVASYILPGQFGVTTFWDMGRVWEKNDNSGKIHHGVGGGIYFAPASLIVFNLVAGYSREGWLPYFSLGFRF